MPTSIISNTVKDGSNVAIPNVVVIIDLIPGPAFRLSDGSEVAAVTSVKTDVTGLWSVALEQSSNLDPAGTYYRVREYVPKTKGGTRVWFFSVPSSNDLLHNNLVIPSIANAIVRPTLVTAFTRPSNPYVGQMIFETDTGNVLFYYGTTLGWLPPWGDSWGEVASIVSATSQNSTSTSYVDITTLTNNSLFAAVQNRRYITELTMWGQWSGGAAIPTFGISDGAATILQERSYQSAGSAITAGDVPVSFFHRGIGTENGVVGRRVRFKTSAFTVNANNGSPHNAILTVFDDGPTGNPVIT